jgi:glutathione peroxidase-family protein
MRSANVLSVCCTLHVCVLFQLTPQYEGLVALHNEFQPAGLEIVASPCDQFAHQEPGR